MAVRFFSTAPQQLLKRFDAAISQSEPKGKITTWMKSKDGQHYTHLASDWTEKAWFKATIQNDCLLFNVVKPKNQNVTTVVYGYYHGHLIETFLNHFDKSFTRAEATALPAAGDRCSE